MLFLDFGVFFFGGLAIFLYGVQTCSEGVQKFAAQKLKAIMQTLVTKPFMPAFLGILMTVAFQSSVASTVLIVEFASIGLVNFAGALEIVLGSAVGTSVIIQLIAFRNFMVALIMVFVGVIFYYFVRSYRFKYLGQALIGFGLIFVGMNFMTTASEPIKSIPNIPSVLIALGKNPIIAILVGLLLTALIQSSTAFFAIMMSLASKGLLTVTGFVPLVIGAHIGGTVTALLSGLMRPNANAKRVAIANTGYKVVAAGLVYPFLWWFEKLVQLTSGDVQRQIANTHLLFAVFMVLIFLPFNGVVGNLLIKWFPAKERTEDFHSFVYINEQSLEIPEIALREVQFEEVRLGKMILENMLKKIPVLVTGSSALNLDEFFQVESDIGWFYHNIFRFLLRMSEKSLSDDQLEKVFAHQFIIKELEYLGDIHITLVQKLKKMEQDNVQPVPESWERLRDIHNSVVDNFGLVLDALTAWDGDAAGKVIQRHPEIMRLERAVQFDVLMGSPGAWGALVEEQLKYLSIDIINLLYEIDEHTVNIAQVIAGVI